MALHARHFDELAEALSRLQRFLEFNIKSSVFKPLQDGLDSIVRLVDNDMLIMFGELSDYQRNYDMLVAPTRDVLTRLLESQQSAGMELIHGSWRLSDGHVTEKVAIARELATTTTAVSTALGFLQFVELTGDVNDFEDLNGVVAIIVERNSSHCRESVQLWISLSNYRVLSYARRLEASLAANSTESWATVLQELRNFWPYGADAVRRVSACLVAFPDMLQRIAVVESARKSGGYGKIPVSATAQSDAVQLLAMLRYSPLLSDSLGERFRNNSVSIAEILRLVNDEPEYTLISDALRRLQSDIQQDLFEPFQRVLIKFRDQLIYDYGEAFKVFGDVSRYSGAAAMNLVRVLHIWLDPVPVGRSKTLRYQQRGEYWPSFSLVEFVSAAAPVKARAVLYEYFKALQSGITEANADLVQATNTVSQLLKRYRAYFQLSVEQAEINQDFVRRVAAHRLYIRHSSHIIM